MAGEHPGRARALHDYRGERVKRATPGMPVEVLGFPTACPRRENTHVVANEREAPRRVSAQTA